MFSFVLLILWASYSPAATPHQPFLWGVANSAFQVEGHPADSDWYRWTHLPGKIADGTNADLGTDFWNRYSDDFDIASGLGANAFRISVAWERIEPKEGQWDLEALEHYREIILSMRAKGLEPLVTLHHFVNPQWLSEKGGVLSKDFPFYFKRFAKKVVGNLARQPTSVRYWITFNEPAVLAMKGFVEGQWPPGIKNDIKRAMKAQSSMAEAHIQASRAIRELNLPVKIGIAHHWRVFQPKNQSLLNKSAAKIADFLFNRYFLNAILRSGESSLDFMGLNYYGRSLVGYTSVAPFMKVFEGDGEKSDLGWEIYPKGIYDALVDVARYKVPLIITKNGVADRGDRLRTNFLKNHISFVMKARQERIPVFGYLHWSLTDNFEWAEGLRPRFGLVEVDYQTLARKPRPSFNSFKELIKSTRDY